MNYLKRKYDSLVELFQNMATRWMKNNVTAVTSFLEKEPKTVGDVRKMLGLSSYYPHSIPTFAKRAQPLHELLTVKPKESL